MISHSDQNPSRALSDEEIALGWAVDCARHHVRGGYVTREDAIYYVKSVIEDEGVDATPEALVDAEIKALKKEQKNWPATGDFEKLMDAFDNLLDDGIIALGNLICCQTCGIEELIEITEHAEKEDPTALDGCRGYTFFHEQDTQKAVDGGGIYLCYGNFPLKDDTENSVRIGQFVVQELREVGLEVNWNEDIKSRIHVPMNWQRRWQE